MQHHVVTNELWPLQMISNRSVIQFNVSKLCCQAEWQRCTDLDVLTRIHLIHSAVTDTGTCVYTVHLHVYVYMWEFQRAMLTALCI